MSKKLFRVIETVTFSPSKNALELYWHILANLDSNLLRFGMSMVILKLHIPYYHAVLCERITRRIWIQVARGLVFRSVLSSDME